uniref:Uncharacterized protein n=1 Tax=Romanomermis culicivorax TaxID=13658 RepID=A0A915JMT4_ROMCU
MFDFYLYISRNESVKLYFPRKLDGNRAKTPSSSKTYVDKLRKWKHDMFDVQEQSPKSRNELFHEYGFDVQRNNDQNKQALPRYRGDDRRNGARYPKKFPTPVVSDNCQQQSNFRSSGFEQKQHYPENRPRSDIPFKKALNPRAERRDDDHSFRNINRVDATHRDEIKQVDHPMKKKDDFPIPKMEFRRRIVVNSEYVAVEQRPHQRYNIPPRFSKNARNFGSSKNTLPTPSNNNRTLALEEEEEDVAEIEEDLGENSESSIQFANDYEAAAAQEQIVRTSQTPPSSGQQHPKRYSAMRQQQYSNTPPPQTATTPPATSTVLPSMQQLHATAPPFMPQQQQPLAAYGQQQIFDG